MSPLIVTALLATFIATIYIYVKYIFSYWKRRGVAYAKPSFPFGNLTPTFSKKQTLGQNLHDLYHSTDAPILGIYASIRPALLIRDPKIQRDILIKDFSYFWHRGFHYDENVDPLAGNLFSHSGKTQDQWRDIRNKLSPSFSSGKLKAIFGTIIDCSRTLEIFLDKLAATEKEIEVRDIFARWTSNVIVSVAFGIEIDCLKNPDDDFRNYGGRFFEPKFKNILRFTISFLSPFFTRTLGVRFVDKDVEHFMKDTVRQTLEYREKNNISRKDFFQLLMQLRNTGQVQDDNSDWKTKSTNKAKSLSIDEMAAQAYVFFIAGYESTSTTMSFCMYELAKNPEIQRKAYEEIESIIQKHDGNLTYEALSEMKYLECCIDETLRINPPFEFFSRQCTKDYKVDGMDLIIEKGTPILFSVTGPHYDPKYYDDPERFDPNRFKDDQNVNKNNAPYMTFGLGPRNCIGMRLGKIQAKLGICLLLRKFAFELGAQHLNKPLEMSPISPVRAPISGINLKVIPRIE